MRYINLRLTYLLTHKYSNSATGKNVVSRYTGCAKPKSEAAASPQATAYRTVSDHQI